VNGEWLGVPPQTNSLRYGINSLAANASLGSGKFLFVRVSFDQKRLKEQSACVWA
jgi:hypothetical protein